MENLAMLLSGFSVLFTVKNVLISILGCILGIIVGAMPGIGSCAGVALLLPMTYGMEPSTAIVLLCSLYMACMFGGSYSAILLNIPGDSPAIMTTLDGYPLAKQRKAAKALLVANTSSFLGGLVGMFILTFTASWLATFGLHFGSAEMTVLLLVAMTSITWLIGDSPTKGLVSTLIGVLLTCIGSDVISGSNRLTFGNLYMMGGIEFTPLVIGAVGLSQIISLVTEKDGDLVTDEKLSMKDAILTRHEWKRILPPILRSSLVGTFVGVLPGAGPTTASFTTYTIQKKMFKNEVTPGEGSIECLAASEAANNSACAGTFAPLLGLGIPGSATSAVLLGGLIMWGLQPGPLLFTNHAEFAWGTIAALFFANILALACGVLLVPLLSKVIQVPGKILVPSVTVICLAGSYAATRSMYGCVIMVIAGVVAYLLTKNGYPMAPLLLGFVLAPLLEKYMRRGFATSAGSVSIFWSSPICIVCLIVFFVLILSPVVRKLTGRIKK